MHKNKSFMEFQFYLKNANSLSLSEWTENRTKHKWKAQKKNKSLRTSFRDSDVEWWMRWKFYELFVENHDERWKPLKVLMKRGKFGLDSNEVNSCGFCSLCLLTTIQIMKLGLRNYSNSLHLQNSTQQIQFN